MNFYHEGEGAHDLIPNVFMQVIKGLDEGILSMKAGGKRRLYIPGEVTSFPDSRDTVISVGLIFHRYVSPQ